MNGRSIAPPLIKFLAFVLVTTLAGGLLVLTIANPSLSDSRTYIARFSRVTGLTPGSEVRISGVKVGQVESIEVVDHGIAKVKFSVSQRKLPVSVTASVKWRNLIGQRYISLERGPGEIDEYLAPGATIPNERTDPPLDLNALLGGFQPLFQALSPKDVNKLSMEIIKVLQGEAGTVESLLAHTASLTKTIAKKDKVIGQVITNLNAVLKTINNRGQELSELIADLQELVSGLASDRNSIGNAIDALGDLTKTTAGLIKDSRPAIRKDIAALRDLSKNLNQNKAVVKDFLQTWPDKLRELVRVGSYGSFFNFFLCKATGSIQVGSEELKLPVLPVTQPRCRP